MRFFTSDHHHYHKNVIDYCNRPFSKENLQEMTDALIKTWNDCVTDSDIVYFLGDFSLNPKHSATIVPQLKGTKVLIPGNHDKCFKFPNQGNESHEKNVKKYLLHGWNFVWQTDEIDIQGFKFRLSHLPYRSEAGNQYDTRYQEAKPIDDGLPMLHGHLHCRYLKFNNMIDVGIDNNFQLLSEDDIISIYKDERSFIPSRLTEFYKERVEQSEWRKQGEM